MKRTTKIIPILLLASLAPFARSGEQSPLKDKTLVVWVAPANLTQRGGSALTIEDHRERYDGIVFGELAAGKWMAGSEWTYGTKTHSRSEKNQDAFPEETADAKTTVQIWHSGQGLGRKNWLHIGAPGAAPSVAAIIHHQRRGELQTDGNQCARLT